MLTIKGGLEFDGAENEGLCGGVNIACDKPSRWSPLVRGNEMWYGFENTDRSRSIDVDDRRSDRLRELISKT
jgi:hypothetical protein